ncbi:MAG TPA: hypothetical protein VGN57_21770 [Pirellulaceae bacterium]|nr:hypothetical protein [Pirellulaceae bacterium]
MVLNLLLIAARYGSAPRRFARMPLVVALGCLALGISAGPALRAQASEGVTQAENDAKVALRALGGACTLFPASPDAPSDADGARHVESVAFRPISDPTNEWGNPAPPWVMKDPHEAPGARARGAVLEVGGPAQAPARKLTAEDLAILKNFPRLRKVDLTATSFDEEGLATLMLNPELEELVLSETLVGDRGIELLEGHPTLSIVRLGRTLTSDAALKSLATLPNLTWVTLDDAATLEGISAISDAPHLKWVETSTTWLTSDELAPLERRGVSVQRVWFGNMKMIGAPTPSDEAYWADIRSRSASSVQAETSHLLDPLYLDRLAASPSVSRVHVETMRHRRELTALLALPQLREIELGANCGTVRYDSIADLIKEVRPAEAPPCIVYGNVVITGAELADECWKKRTAAPHAQVPIYADYIIEELRPEDVERLNELPKEALATLRIEPRSAVGERAVRQSRLLSALAPVFFDLGTHRSFSSSESAGLPSPFWSDER